MGQIECPQKGCGGYLDEWFCSMCGKVTPLSSLLGRSSPAQKVLTKQQELEDFAIREASG